MSKILVNLLLLFSFFSFADEPEFEFGDRQGLWVNPDLAQSDRLVIPAGQNTTLRGNVCAVKIRTGFSAGQCTSLRTNSLNVSSFFPDELTEVTEATQFSKNRNQFSYSFVTPNLSVDQNNTFTIIVGTLGEKTKKYNQLIAKLNKILLLLNQRRISIVKNPKADQFLPWYDEMIAKFEKTRNTLERLVENSPDVLARYTLPLQVGNSIANKQVESSVFNGLRLALETPKGVHFDGEVISANLKLTNLTNLDFHFPLFDDDHDNDHDDRDPSGENYTLEVKRGRHVVYTQDIDSLPLGVEKTFPFSFGKIDSNDDSDIDISLYRKVKWFRFTYPVRVAELKTQILVADDSSTPQWVINNYTNLINYVQNIKDLNFKVNDSLGMIDPASFESNLVFTDLLGITTSTEAKNLFTLTNLDQGRSYEMSFQNLNLAEGIYSLNQTIKDSAANFASPSPLSFLFQIDRTAPTQILAQTDHQLTNQRNFPIEMLINDRSPVTTELSLNGVVIQTFSGTVVSTSVTLTEGYNDIKLTTVDAAGNSSTTELSDIKLDTIPPVLDQLSPADQSSLFSLEINFSGRANEPLSKIVLNGIENSLNGALNFQTTATALYEGTFNLELVAYDLAGNQTTKNLSYQIILKVLRAELIKIEPKNGKLQVIGLAGAAIPGSEIDISGGFFNSKHIVANNDGSFEVSLNPTSEVIIDGKIPSLHKEDTVDLKYNADTTLSGIVKDISNNPLPGVTVTIVSSGQTATTDVSGVFKIAKPITGDQEILIDGTTISESITGSAMKFSKTNLNLSIGNLQQNVMERTVYLTPLMLDGSETITATNQDVIVTGPYAPGVEIHIPANSAIFPDGSAVGAINMYEISKEVTTIPVPSFAEPDTVIALEPSGLKFTQPVKLVLPNVNQFPPDMEVVIMSKNSASGVWEINGAAKVSFDGSSIITKDEMGITHFSEVYAAPYGLDTAPAKSTDIPGIDTFNGSMNSAVTLPGYKSLGQSLAPSLYYSSRWAYPNAVLKNTFDIPRKEMTQNGSFSGGSWAGKVSVNDSITTWLEPEWIDAWFIINDLVTSKARFAGIPNKSTVTYAADLSTLASGIYPYNSNYEIKLRQMILRRREITTKKLFSGSSTEVQLTKDSQLIDDVFPVSIPGKTFIQNKMSSESGQGWKIGLAKTIINPDSPQIAIEGNDGKIATYSIDSNVDTLLYKSSGIKVASLNNYPNVFLFDQSNNLFQVDLTTPDNISQVSSLSNYQGGVGFNYAICGAGRPELCSQQEWCWQKRRAYVFDRLPNNLLTIGVGNVFGADGTGSIFSYRNNNLSRVSGLVGLAPVQRNDQAVYDSISPFCNSNSNLHCGGDSIVNWLATVGRGTCQSLQSPPNTGEYPIYGFSDGLIGSAQFNGPRGISAGNGANQLLVADTGNNRIRLVDINTNSVSTFAGNGQTYDNGDGGLAIDASIYHPRGIAKDSQGNVYISTERGHIRKIDSSGRISTIAGKNETEGGILSLSTTVDKVYLNNPYDMAIDEDNNYLYVADTGNNRIVRLDFNTNKAVQIAGNNTCNGAHGDGDAGLNATFCRPEHIGLDDQKNLLILDSSYGSIRRLTFSSASIGKLTYRPTAKDNSVLSRNANGTFTLSYRNGVKDYFDSTGKQTSSIDRIGVNVNYNYDGDKLTSVTDPVGRSTSLNYGATGLLSTITDPAGRVTEFFYTANKLTQVQFPDGTTRSFSYNQKGLMTGETNQRGVATQYLYNQWDRLTQVNVAGVSQGTINDADSKTLGQNTFINNAQNYDGILDPKGVETKFNKDLTGFVATITDAEGKVTTIERNLDGKPIKITRLDSSFTTFTYNSTTGDLVSKFDSLSNSTQTYNYDTFGNLLSYTNPRGFTSTNTYDSATGLLTSSRDALGNTSSKAYGSYGLITSQSNALGQSASYQYDTFGNLFKVTSNAGKVSTMTRDSAGNVIAATNAKGQVTQYEYDVMNRLVSVTTPRGLKTQYTYLATGELSVITDPIGNMTRFEYDNLGRLIKKTDALGFVTTLSYDLNSNLAREVDPNGNIKTYNYDSLNRLTSKVLPDNIYQMNYDIRGNIAELSDNDSSFVYSYERFGDNDLVTSIQISGTNQIAASLSYDYDQNGNQIKFTGPAGITNYTYDQLDRLTSLSTPSGRVYNYTLDQIGRLTRIAGGQIKTDFSYDADNALSSMSTRNNSNQNLYSLNLTRDLINNITQKTTNQGVYSYSYDNDSELITASNPEVSDSFSLEEFVYDQINNRIADQLGTQNFDSKKQRLSEDYQYLYVYDSNGNLTSKQEKTFAGNLTNYTYNSENQLILIDQYESNILKKRSVYTYDALGRRSSKSFTNLTDSTKSFARNYLYDGDEIIAEYDNSNNLLISFAQSGLRTDDTLSFIVTTEGKNQGLAPDVGEYFYLKDQLGSITGIVNQNGTIVQKYIYSSFGKILKITDVAGMDSTTNPDFKTNFTFTNREYDFESGLYYYRARYFDSNTGRFLQTDPYPGILSIPSTFNSTYIYVLNRPTLGTDPRGRIWPIIIAAIAVGVINAEVNKGNGKSWLTNFAIGAAVGASSAYIIGVAAAAGGTNVGLSITYGALAGAGTSVGGQMVTNGTTSTDQINWFSVGIGALAGGIAGGFSSMRAAGQISKGQAATAETADGVNKSAIQGVIESGPKASPPKVPSSLEIECGPLTGSSYRACMGY